MAIATPFCAPARPRDPRQGAAGADCADEAVDLAAGLLPDFRAGRLEVDLAVGGIVELVGQDRALRLLAGESLGETPRDLHVIIVAVGRRRNLDQGRAEQRSMSFFSWLCVSGMTITVLIPANCRPTPGRCRCFGSAVDHDAAGLEQAAVERVADDEPSAARSFTDWPGFMNSALARILQPVSSDARRSLISGVLPIAARTVSRMSMPPRSTDSDFGAGSADNKAGGLRAAPWRRSGSRSSRPTARGNLRRFARAIRTARRGAA